MEEQRAPQNGRTSDPLLPMPKKSVTKAKKRSSKPLSSLSPTLALALQGELHALDPSTRNSDLYQHIATLSHQYIILWEMVVQPIFPEEASAIRAELRLRLLSLGRRALIRHSLGSFASVNAELEEWEEEMVVEDEEGWEEDLELDPSTEDQDVGNAEDESRRPFRLEIPITVIRHISTNILQARLALPARPNRPRHSLTKPNRTRSNVISSLTRNPLARLRAMGTSRRHSFFLSA